MHDLSDLDWLSLTFSCYLRCLSYLVDQIRFFTISTQRNLYASRFFLVSLVPWIDKPWGNTLREKLHEPCTCGIQIGGAKDHQQRRPRIKQYSNGMSVNRECTQHHWCSLRNTLKGGVVHLPRLEVSHLLLLVLLLLVSLEPRRLLTLLSAPDLYTASARFRVAFPSEYSPKVYQSTEPKRQETIYQHRDSFV